MRYTPANLDKLLGKPLSTPAPRPWPFVVQRIAWNDQATLERYGAKLEDVMHLYKKCPEPFIVMSIPVHCPNCGKYLFGTQRCNSCGWNRTLGAP